MPIHNLKRTTRRLLGAALLAGAALFAAGGTAEAGPHGHHDGYVDVRGGHDWGHRRHRHRWHHHRHHHDDHGYRRHHHHHHGGYGHHRGW